MKLWASSMKILTKVMSDCLWHCPLGNRIGDRL